jgi:hypothetical protein
VTKVEGTTVTLLLEEGIAVGPLDEVRSIAILWHGRREAAVT